MTESPTKNPDRVLDLLGAIESQAKVGDLGGFSSTITSCLTPPKLIHEVAAAEGFWESARILFGGVPADNDHAVTLALGEVGRLHASLKSRSRRLQPLAIDILTRKTPRHFCHGDADLATFAAKGWACSQKPVDLKVAVRTVVMAEAPKPLVPWLELAFSAGDVDAALAGIAGCLREIASVDAEQPPRRAGRLQRVLRALRSTASADRVAQGGRTAAALADLVDSAYRGVPIPPYAAAAKAVEELMDLAVHLIRMDLRLLTAPAIYDSVAKATAWLPRGGWRRFTRSSASAAKLRKILLDGLVILLKQHNPSETLIECHRALSADRQAALAEQRAVAQADREIPSVEQTWLASGGTTSLVSRAHRLTETDDTAIGMALLASEALTHCQLVNSGCTADGSVRELIERAREVRERVLTVARRRKLTTFGSRGEVVQFSPAVHRLIDARTPVEDVEILEPGVESQGEFGVRVVVPALVKERA